MSKRNQKAQLDAFAPSLDATSKSIRIHKQSETLDTWTSLATTFAQPLRVGAKCFCRQLATMGAVKYTSLCKMLHANVCSLMIEQSSGCWKFGPYLRQCDGRFTDQFQNVLRINTQCSINAAENRQLRVVISILWARQITCFT